jgi:hypothetical protein
MRLHVVPQDTECDAWGRLLEMIEVAVEKGHEEFGLEGYPPSYEDDEAGPTVAGLTPVQAGHIVTLPPSIAKLKGVRRLYLYASSLTRIPPEISEMSSLGDFDPYTSYWLHWFPFEIARCPNLRESRVSTRALYGNYKYRMPFPALDERPRVWVDPASVFPEWDKLNNRPCSVCGQAFVDRQEHRAWISLRVATDVLPLLVNACSEACLGRLPEGDARHVRTAHKGGPNVEQPPPGYR